MSECGDTMSDGSLRRLPMSFRGVLVSLTGLFMSRQVLLFPVLLGNAMGVPGDIVQFRGLRVIFVM